LQETIEAERNFRLGFAVPSPRWTFRASRPSRDAPERRLTTLNEARALVDKLLAQRPFRQMARDASAARFGKTEEEGSSAIGALRAPAIEHLA
jgi:hypothetical protein